MKTPTVKSIIEKTFSTSEIKILFDNGVLDDTAPKFKIIFDGDVYAENYSAMINVQFIHESNGEGFWELDINGFKKETTNNEDVFKFLLMSFSKYFRVPCAEQELCELKKDEENEFYY
jgi:hypothetical protein